MFEVIGAKKVNSQVASEGNSQPVSMPKKNRMDQGTLGQLSVALTWVLALVLVMLFGVNASAQGDQKSTPRGIQAGNSYSISDIETINTTGGNLMLNIPLAKLPAGRGGMSAGLGLVYNSKLWDLNIAPYTTGCNPHSQGCTPVQREFHSLKPSEDAGWRYAVRYEIKDEPAGHSYIATATEGSDVQPCASEQSGGWYRPAVVTPDGTQHALRIQGARASTDFYSDGSYPFTLDGTPHDGLCHMTAPNRPAAGTVLTYFTVDGSFLRLDVTVGTTEADSTWVLYMPDGTRVAQTTTYQRIYDRNGNYIDITGSGNYNGTGHVADILRDQLNREVAIEYNSATNEDTVHMTGFDGAALSWKVKWKTIYVNQKYIAGFAGNSTPGILLQRSQRVVDSVTLPVQLGDLNYTFDYNANNVDAASPADLGWGEIRSVKTPLGAVATYDYKRDNPGENLSPEEVLNNFPVTKTLTFRCEYADGCGGVAAGGDVTEQWHYDYAFTTPSDWKKGWSTVTGPDGGTVRQDFNTDGESISRPVGEPFRTTNPDGTIVERIWAENRPAAAYNPSPNQFVNPYVEIEFTTLVNQAGTPVLTAIRDTDYDKNGNVTKVKEYGFVPANTIPRNTAGQPTGIPSGVYPARTTVTEYYAGTPAASDHSTSSIYAYYDGTAYGAGARYLQAVKSSEIHSVAAGGAETPVARSENGYDNAFTTGNLTAARTCDSYKGGTAQTCYGPLSASNSISVSTVYNAYGMPTQMTDARETVTQISYDAISSGSSVTGLYPTKTEVAANRSTLKLTTTAQYDFDTGAVIESKDVDNDVKSVTEYDALARPTLVRSAADTNLESRTSMAYDTALRLTTSRSDLNVAGDGMLVKVEHFDQLGRTWLSRVLEDPATQSATDPSAGIKVQTRYGNADAGSNGYSYQLTSNPYRATSLAGASNEPTMGWTRNITRADGSRSEVETFAGASVPEPGATGLVSTGKVATLRDANRTYVRDQADKWRMSETNALGQLVAVTEDPTANLFGYTHTGTNLVTNYTYDTLSNLTQVNQGSQTPRQFVYSSLGRLLSASNPESGTINYKYDDSGNLIEKTDARPVTTAYAYDYLNRPTGRTYTDGTPSVTYSYDSVPQGKGKLASVSSTVSTTAYTSYDVSGRLTGSQQTTDGQTYAMSYGYNLAGALVKETYPSGREVHHSYASDGKLASVSSRVAANRPFKAYAQAFSYNAAGAVTGMQLGNMRWESTQFNSRLQPTQIALGTTPGATDMLKLNYGYDDGTNIDRNNGNVISQNITVPTVGQTPGFVAKQSYTYDELNRLKSATEMTAGTPETLAWKQTYIYDRFGNRTFDAANTTTLPQGFNPAIYNPTISQANNRFADGQGYLYDPAGNVTQDSTGRKFAYDGENKQKSFGVGGLDDNGGKYFYDGDGRRMKKVVGNETTIFVYNGSGQIVAEYATTAPLNPQLNYLTADYLGSPRINTDANGSVSARHDYMPFGEEILSIGNRGALLAYGGDGILQKFTGQERDLENGLDFFKTRYYSGVHGRFTSPDSMMASGRVSNPQTWNRFVFVINNPLRFVDPDGRAETNPWDMLTEDQQGQIRNKVKCAEGQSVEDAFNELFKGKNAEQTAAVIYGLQLVMSQVADNAKIWDQIKSFDGGWNGENNSVGLSFSVSNSKDFLSALSESNYSVDSLNEMVNIGGGHRHSARQRTVTSYDAALHFVQQKTYSDQRFDAHFDFRSVNFENRDEKTFPDFRDYPGPKVSGRVMEEMSAALAHSQPHSIYETGVKVGWQMIRGNTPSKE
jgi:RHS repeat-associated protein